MCVCVCVFVSLCAYVSLCGSVCMFVCVTESDSSVHVCISCYYSVEIQF